MNLPPATKSSTTMATPIYSRQYLRDLPEVKRQTELRNEIAQLYSNIIHPLTLSAQSGKTKYFHDMTDSIAQKKQQRMHEQQHTEMMIKHGMVPVINTLHQSNPEPSDEVIAGLREKFPDCLVSFQEDWIETQHGMKQLKKGILIDWS